MIHRKTKPNALIARMNLTWKIMKLSSESSANSGFHYIISDALFPYVEYIELRISRAKSRMFKRFTAHLGGEIANSAPDNLSKCTN